MDIRFVSGSKDKIREAETILGPVGVRVKPIELDIDEIQTKDLELLVRDKALKAFKKIGRPLFVEHTGLYLDGLNDLPGGLTRIFWENIGAEMFSKLVSKSASNRVTARCIIGYCDLKKIHCCFKGEIKGTVPPEPKGNDGWGWDNVFIPDRETQTFAEMGEKRKAEISMRRLALEQFADFLRRVPR